MAFTRFHHDPDPPNPTAHFYIKLNTIRKAHMNVVYGDGFHKEQINALNEVIDEQKLDKLIETTKNQLIKQIPQFSVDQINNMLQITGDIDSDDERIEIDEACSETVIERIINGKIQYKSVQNIIKKYFVLSPFNIHAVQSLHKMATKDPSMLSDNIIIAKLSQCINDLKTKHTYGFYSIYTGYSCSNTIDPNAVKTIFNMLSNVVVKKQRMFPEVFNICGPFQSVQTLVCVSKLIACMKQQRFLNVTNRTKVLASLNFLITFNIDEILINTLQSYQHLLSSIKKEKHSKILSKNISSIHTKNINNMVVKWNKDNHLIEGYSRTWDQEPKSDVWDIDDVLMCTYTFSVSPRTAIDEEEEKVEHEILIPKIINQIVYQYYSPINRMQINYMKSDNIKRFVDLTKHYNENVVSHSLSVLCCVSEQYMVSMIKNRLWSNLQIILKRNHQNKEVYMNVMQLILKFISFGSNNQIQQFMEIEILYPFLTKMLMEFDMNVHYGKQIRKMIRKILKVYNYSADILSSTAQKIMILSDNKDISQSTKTYLNKLLNDINCI